MINRHFTATSFLSSYLFSLIKTVTIPLLIIIFQHPARSTSEPLINVEHVDSILNLAPHCRHNIILLNNVNLHPLISNQRRIVSCVKTGSSADNNVTKYDKDALLATCKNPNQGNKVGDYLFLMKDFTSVLFGGCNAFFVFSRGILLNLNVQNVISPNEEIQKDLRTLLFYIFL